MCNCNKAGNGSEGQYASLMDGPATTGNTSVLTSPTDKRPYATGLSDDTAKLMQIMGPPAPTFLQRHNIDGKLPISTEEGVLLGVAVAGLIGAGVWLSRKKKKSPGKSAKK